MICDGLEIKIGYLGRDIDIKWMIRIDVVLSLLAGCSERTGLGIDPAMSCRSDLLFLLLLIL
jgi:hypothetical protein